MTSLPIIAAFDFDHTLTNRDSLLPFLFYMQGKVKTLSNLAALSPAFIRFLLKDLSRQAVKEQILKRFMGGQSFVAIEALGRAYVEKQLDHYLKPEAMQRLRWHQAQGHRCVLVSASLEFYLKPWALRYGFEDVLASRLEITSAGLITGRLKGLNCWGPEKVRRLLDYLGPKEKYELYVYGDSQGDRELLALADYPFYRTFE